MAIKKSTAVAAEVAAVDPTGDHFVIINSSEDRVVFHTDDASLAERVLDAIQQSGGDAKLYQACASE